jgi:hypothetical protein
MVYLPMAYLYGKKFVGPITPTILAIREEIYDMPYHKIDWGQTRSTCAKVFIHNLLSYIYILLVECTCVATVPLILFLFYVNMMHLKNLLI